MQDNAYYDSNTCVKKEGNLLLDVTVGIHNEAELFKFVVLFSKLAYLLVQKTPGVISMTG